MRRASLRLLAEGRGLDASAAAACVTADYGNGWFEVDTDHPAYPRAKPGLGDLVKAGLSAIGITEERVSAVIGRPCGCSQRAGKLNAAGAKYLGLPPGKQG